MTIGVTTKVRLVQCPRCRQVLPELADFPLHKCGGCGAILQAKNRKSDPKSIYSGLHETDAALTNAVDLVVEDKESNNSNKEILTSLGECSLDQNNERDQKQSGDCISEQLGGINLSNEDQNDERNQSQSEDCYGEQLGGVNLSHYYQSGDIDKIESCDCNVEQLGVSNEVCLSTELASQGNEEPSPIAQANSEVEANDEGLLSAGAKSEIDIKEGDSNFRSLNTDNLANKSKWDQDELLEPTIHGRPVENWRRRERDSHPSRVPFYQRGSLSGYESGGPSHEVHNQFDRNTSFRSFGKSEDLEQDKMILLRMVSELQDELSKRNYPSGMANARVSTWKEKHIPSHYDHEAAEEELNRVSAENRKLMKMLVVICESYNALRSQLMDQLSKNRKSDPKSIDSGLHETDAAQTNAVDLVVEDKESNSSNKEILTSLGECSLDQNNERDQKQSGDCISERLGGINLSNEDQNDERNQSQSEDCYGEQLGGVNLSHNYQSRNIDKIESYDNSDPGSLIREETSTSLVEDSFLLSTKPESSGRIWDGTNTIPDFTKELPILSLFPTDKSGIDANSESKETPPRFNHYSNSYVSLFPPATSPDSSENDEITIPNPSIPSSFPQVFPPPNGQAALSIPLHLPLTMSNTSSESNKRPNGQTTLSIPLHFPPTRSDTSSESDQTFNGKTNLSNPLLFPAYKSETETDDSTNSESNESFRTFTSRQMVVQGSHLLPLLKQMMPRAQMSCNMQQAQAVQTTNATSSASYARGYSLQRNLRLQQQQRRRRQQRRQQERQRRQWLQQQLLQLETQIHNSQQL